MQIPFNPLRLPSNAWMASSPQTENRHAPPVQISEDTKKNLGYKISYQMALSMRTLNELTDADYQSIWSMFIFHTESGEVNALEEAGFSCKHDDPNTKNNILNLVDILKIDLNAEDLKKIQVANRCYVPLGCMDSLAERLRNNTTTTTLQISRSELENEDAKLLAEALKTNMTLTTLDLSHNFIGIEGMRAFRDALKVNTTLTMLEIATQRSNKESEKDEVKKVLAEIDAYLEQNKKPGSREFQLGMERLHEADFKSAIQHLEQSRNQNYPDATYYLGEAHMAKSWFTNDPDFKKAGEYFDKAAGQKHRLAATKATEHKSLASTVTPTPSKFRWYDLY